MVVIRIPFIPLLVIENKAIFYVYLQTGIIVAINKILAHVSFLENKGSLCG